MSESNETIQKIDMDNGWFPLANDVMPVLAKTSLSGSHFGILYAVLDKTYGWYDKNSQKKQGFKQRHTIAHIKYAFFQNITGQSKSKVSKRVNELIAWKVIHRSAKQPYQYSFNCHVYEWDRCVFRKKFQQEGWGFDYSTGESPKQIVPQTGNPEFPDEGTKTTPGLNENSNLRSPKETIYKEKDSPLSEYREIASLLGEKIRGNDPDFRITGQDYRKWADTARLLVEEDNRPIDEIRELIVWSQNHDYWQANVLSMNELRKHYTRVKLQMKQDENKSSKKIDPYVLAEMELDRR